MASANRRQHPTVTLNTGDLVDDVTRVAQQRPDAESRSIRVNLSHKGSWYHDIEGGEELSLLIFEEGIWVTTTDE